MSEQPRQFGDLNRRETQPVFDPEKRRGYAMAAQMDAAMQSAWKWYLELEEGESGDRVKSLAITQAEKKVAEAFQKFLRSGNTGGIF